MDRGRSFSILGLSETATKGQVEAAYARKVARYKGPDYAEEPAYVERKLAQLYQAYQEALSLASDGDNTHQPSRVERDADRSAKKKTAKASRLLEEERDAAEHNNREKFHQWLERRDDENQKRREGGKKPILKLTKPDFSKLKDRLQEMKEEVATQLELNSSDEEPVQEYLVTEEMELTDDADSFAAFAEECIYTDSGERLGRDGKVTRNPSTASEDDTVYVPSKPDTNKKKGELAGTILSIVVALVMLFTGSCEGDNTDTSYEEPAYSYIYENSAEDVDEADHKIVDLAGQSHSLLSEQIEHGSATLKDERQSDYQPKADLFAKNFWGKDSIAEVTDYLYQNYGSYFTSTDEPLTTQLDAIFAFYGFASLETAQWYDQPYTGDRIQGYGDYLDYLNQFYEAQ